MCGLSWWLSTSGCGQQAWFSTNSQVLTFLNFPHFHAFRDGSLRMTLDSNSSNMEEPNVIEWKQLMNFYTSIAIVPNIFEGVCRQIFGKLWILITSHGFLVWSWLNQHTWYNFSHPSTLHLHPSPRCHWPQPHGNQILAQWL